MKKLLSIVMVLVAGCTITAQERPESYNYKHGIEAMQNGQIEEALDFFDKDLKDNPKNGYAHSWVAMIKDEMEEYGKALTSAELAIKYLPARDTEYVAFAYSTRGSIYLHLEDTTKAIADYSTAISKQRNYSLYGNRAHLYYSIKEYDLADADYREMIEIDPGETLGYMGIGRNALAQERWDDAIKQFDYATKLDSELSSGYSYRAEAYMGKEKWQEAIDDIVKALTLSWDDKALYLISKIKGQPLDMLISKLAIQSVKFPKEASWPFIIGMLCDSNKLYERAINYYEIANSIKISDITYQNIAMCYFEIGDYEAALTAINQAIEIDDTDYSHIACKANILYEMGEIKSAISEWDKVLTIQPDYGYGYYRRGWFKLFEGDLDEAVKDLSISIVLEPDYSYAYESRGDIYMKQGKKELAEADFRKIIEIEDSPEKYECIHYAFHGLGQDKEAIAAMQQIIDRDPTDAGSYYDAACLYSRMHDVTNALRYLEKSLELGYNRFAHIDQDYDMDFLRNSEIFKALINKYKALYPHINKEQRTIYNNNLKWNNV